MFLIVFFPTFAGNFKSYVFYNEYAPTRRTLFRWFHVFSAPGAPPGGTFSCNFCAQARCFVHVASLPSRRQRTHRDFEQENTGVLQRVYFRPFLFFIFFARAFLFRCVGAVFLSSRPALFCGGTFFGLFLFLSFSRAPSCSAARARCF